MSEHGSNMDHPIIKIKGPQENNNDYSFSSMKSAASNQSDNISMNSFNSGINSKKEKKKESQFQKKGAQKSKFFQQQAFKD